MSMINGFSGDYTGLTEVEAKKLLLKFGPNELKSEKKFSLLLSLFSVLKEPMFLLLFGTATCYFILGEPGDGSIMLVFVVFIAGISFYQEYKTDKTLQALKKLTAPYVHVIRNSKLRRISSCELVPGDLMVVNEGEKISADGRIIELFDLGIDESILTGEAETVWKKIHAPDAGNHWRLDYIYAGTTVIYGTAVVEVIATAFDTEYGQISRSVQEVQTPKTPLENDIGKLVRYCAFIGLGCCLLCFMIFYISRRELIGAILAGITLGMSIIPEELPVILTVFMAIGAWKLARINALMRRIPAVETLGSVSVLCADKTGTLTENNMHLEHVRPSSGQTPDELLELSVLASENVPFDPMEQAVQRRAADAGLNISGLLSHKLRYEYPFNSETRMMGHVWDIDGELWRCIKGSPENIVALCGMNDVQQKETLAIQQELMRQGCRVIAVAVCKGGKIIENDIKNHIYSFAGLLGFADPPRQQTPAAIQAATQAGIRVMIITGDHALTAQAIAGRIGVMMNGDTITGTELNKFSDAQLCGKIQNTTIFARVMPKHKLRIVKALQANGEIVAMTGDGVNDAPALKAADIGIAMGKRGTEVAREAADMILLDDNFSTIVHSIKDGRRIYDNIRKAIGYVLVIHIPIALLALMNPLVFPGLLLLLPIHVVLLELVIDPTCSIIFERLPPEPNTMTRPPRKRTDSILNCATLFKSLSQGSVIFALAAAGIFYLKNTGTDAAEIRSFMLFYLVIANFFLVYVNASEFKSCFRIIWEWRDKVVWIINMLIILLPFLLIYIPISNRIAKTAPFCFMHLCIALGLAVVASLWYEIFKLKKNAAISAAAKVTNHA